MQYKLISGINLKSFVIKRAEMASFAENLGNGAIAKWCDWHGSQLGGCPRIPTKI